MDSDDVYETHSVKIKCHTWNIKDIPRTFNSNRLAGELVKYIKVLVV